MGSGWSKLLCVHNVSKTLVGRGERDFKRAKSLLKSWEHFKLGWAYTNVPEIAVGRPVIVIAQSLGLWTVNPLRISSKQDSRHKMSFTHRTLYGHQLAGKETFSLEMRSNGDVVYGIETVSQPATLIATLTYPIVRMHQTKFKDDSINHIKNLMKCTHSN
jgi:uncharacterized protein (UPF0548 family)